MSAERGFTLVETLVALAVVAVTLSAGTQAAQALINNVQRFDDVSAAQWCADNELIGLRLAKRFPAVGDSAFSCEQLGRRYSGTLAVRPTPNPNFRRIDAHISDAQGRPLLNLSTVQGRY